MLHNFLEVSGGRPVVGLALSQVLLRRPVQGHQRLRTDFPVVSIRVLEGGLLGGLDPLHGVDGLLDLLEGTQIELLDRLLLEGRLATDAAPLVVLNGLYDGSLGVGIHVAASKLLFDLVGEIH